MPIFLRTKLEINEMIFNAEVRVAETLKTQNNVGSNKNAYDLCRNLRNKLYSFNKQNSKPSTKIASVRVCLDMAKIQHNYAGGSQIPFDHRLSYARKALEIAHMAREELIDFEELGSDRDDDLK